MKVEIIGKGAFQSCKVNLESGESFISESGAMTRMSASIDYEVTTKTKGGGGVFAGLKRLLSSDAFFLSHYTAKSSGEIVLAPALVGNVHVFTVDGSSRWLCAGGSFLGCGPDVSVETQFQGFKGLIAGKTLFFIEVSGQGPVVVNAFGHISEIDVDGTYIVDTGHVVAFESSLQYNITKAGGSWLQSFFAGEGFVLRFSGKGKVIIQSHNPDEFGTTIGPQLPERRS